MLKYSLTIEGTAKEIEEEKKKVQHVTSNNTFEYPPRLVKHTVEYKVVEPLRVEFTTEVDHLNRVPLQRGIQDYVYQLGGNYAGKKVKVVITEEE